KGSSGCRIRSSLDEQPDDLIREAPAKAGAFSLRRYIVERWTRTVPALAYMSVMRPQDILMPVAAGLYCKPGGFHIDPVRPVDRAIITHGHSDHARPGHGTVLATQETLDIMRLRYGDDFAGSTQAISYG